MNIEQLEQAQKKAQELIKFHRKNELIKDFIANIKERQYVRLVGVNGADMWNDGGEVFELCGKELIELLEEKHNERSRYVSQIKPDELIDNEV